MQLDLYEAYDDALDLAVELVRKGRIIIFPTDTLYGIGGDATKLEVVRRIYELKRRPFDKPVSILVSGMAEIEELCVLSLEERQWLMQHLPGPYTVLLRLKEEKRALFPWLKREKIGIRVPDHAFIRKVAELAGTPIVATSANISGQPSPTHHSEVPAQLAQSCDLFIKAGPTRFRRPSRVIDPLTGEVLR